jgi:transcriptional regulator with XRE-family HTH domain
MEATQLLGRNIRFHLFRTQLTLRDVSEASGISPYSLGRMASGKTKLIDPNVLVDLMQVFKCDANALLMPIDGVPYDI